MLVEATKSVKGSSASASSNPRCIIFLIWRMRFLRWLQALAFLTDVSSKRRVLLLDDRSRQINQSPFIFVAHLLLAVAAQEMSEGSAALFSRDVFFA